MRRTVLVLLSLFSIGATARAERHLTLDETLQLARRQSRDLQAARARLAQAATSVEQAWSALLPSVVAQGKYTHNYKEVTLDVASFSGGLFALADIIKATSRNPIQNGVINQFEQTAAEQLASQSAIVIQKAEQLDFVASATVPLVVPAAYPGLSAAKKSYRSAEASFAATEAALLFSTAQAFYAAAGTDELVAARAHAVEVAQKTRDDAKARFEAGVVNRVELMRAQLALERAQQASTETEDARRQAYRGLATLVQLREPFRVEPGAIPEARPRDEQAHPGAVAERALTLRPEVAALERGVEAARAQSLSSALRWAPALSAFGNVRAFNYKSFAGDYYGWAVGAQLDWQLYDGGVRDAARHLADAQKRESELRLLQLRDNVTDDVINAEETLATKRRALDTAENAVKLSQETLNLVRSQRDAGTATQLDLLTAQDTLVGAEVGRAQARFDLQLSDLNLQRIAGTFPAKN